MSNNPILYGIPKLAVAEGYPSTNQIQFCNITLPGLYETPTTCYEAKDLEPQQSLETAVLFAEGTNSIYNLVYPKEVMSLHQALISYEEPVYPIPVGASVYYFIMIGWVASFYFTHLGRKLFYNFIIKLDLYPEAHRFPYMPLYWLQQTKKESEHRRKGRNTWAWLARRYVLSPDDPLLANVDVDMVWTDFELSQNTHSLITLVLKENDLFLKVTKGEAGRKEFEIVKRRDLDEIPMNGTQVRRIFLDQLQLQDNVGKKSAGILHGYKKTEKKLEEEGVVNPNRDSMRDSRGNDGEILYGDKKSISSPPHSDTEVAMDELAPSAKPMKKSRRSNDTDPDPLDTTKPRAIKKAPIHDKPTPSTAAVDKWKQQTKKNKGDKSKMQQQSSEQEETQEENTDEIPSQLPFEQEQPSIEPAELTEYQSESKTELKWELPPLTQPVEEEEPKDGPSNDGPPKKSKKHPLKK